MTDEVSPRPSAEAAPQGVDVSVPHSPRIWNYWLGGKDNFTVDREIGARFREIFPQVVDVARASRSFLTRSIRYLADDVGIRQFLDIGTGLPTVDNTHEVAQRVAPDSRIVYVDNDPIVLAYARALLTPTPQGATAYLDADLRDPDTIVRKAAETLDFDRPTALILSGIVGHIPDDDEARSLVRRLLAALPPGSYLSLNDGTNVIGGDAIDEAIRLWNESGSIPFRLRTPEEIASFFDGLELVEPGVVSCPRWRPEHPAAEPPIEVDAFGGVARKS